MKRFIDPNIRPIEPPKEWPLDASNSALEEGIYPIEVEEDVIETLQPIYDSRLAPVVEATIVEDPTLTEEQQTSEEIFHTENQGHQSNLFQSTAPNIHEEVDKWLDLSTFE
jgi:hypothetical protein